MRSATATARRWIQVMAMVTASAAMASGAGNVTFTSGQYRDCFSAISETSSVTETIRKDCEDKQYAGRDPRPFPEGGDYGIRPSQHRLIQ